MYQRIKCGFQLFLQDIRALLPAILAVAAYWGVTHVLFDRFCPLQILFDFPCPGCGMTRALGLVLTGHFAAAWSLQPPVYGWIAAGLGFGIQRYLADCVISQEMGSVEAESGKQTADVEKHRRKRANMWTWVLIALLLWGIALYGLRLIQGFPTSVEDPGRTLYELLRR